MRFGKLTALKRLGRSSVGATLWECLCDCGTTAVVTLINLTKNNTKSCGCLKSQPSKTRHNLSGRRFGRLVAIHPDGPLKWMCVCDCGNNLSVSTIHLTRDHTKSCGCLAKILNPTGSQLDRRLRNNSSSWAKNVVASANYRCDVCGNTSNLHAHHIMPWAGFIEMRYLDDNGACLCKECHYKIHRMINNGVSGGHALATAILNKLTEANNV